MIKIKASLVKALREKTGAGMMDCKKALEENGGDMSASVDWLRAQGLSAAAKKSARITSEGLVGLAINTTKGALVEVNTETDFVARNENFQVFVKTLTNISLEGKGSVDDLNSAPYINSKNTVGETITNMIATIGENMHLRRVSVLESENGVVSSYMHNALQPGLGKIGVLLALDSLGDQKQLETLGKKLAMHIAATNPHALSRETIDSSELEREKNVLTEQARESGKPDEIIEKMVEGRLRKYYEEVCLLEQTFVIDGETRISEVINEASVRIGTPIKISGFVRFALGEGIEKKEEAFAEEVAAAAGI